MASSTCEHRPVLKLAQIAWVVPDLEKTKHFFSRWQGILHFSPTGTTRLQDFDGTYYGKAEDAENLVAMAYSGGAFLEIIQPLSGKSIFGDYLQQHPTGGLHHIAYSTPVTHLAEVIEGFEEDGFPVVSSFDTPIAKIVFFDTRKQNGVFTEIMGITPEGEPVVEEMKKGLQAG